MVSEKIGFRRGMFRWERENLESFITGRRFYHKAAEETDSQKRENAPGQRVKYLEDRRAQNHSLWPGRVPDRNFPIFVSMTTFYRKGNPGLKVSSSGKKPSRQDHP